MTGLRGSSRLIALAKISFLARFLGPFDFGIFALVTLTLSLVEMLTETGVNIFLLQEKDSIDKYLDSAWFISIIRGLLIGLIVILITPLLSGFFKSPSVVNFLYPAGLIPIIRGFINPACIKFRKELRFNSEFFYRSIINTIEVVSTLVFVLFWPTALALVLGLTFSAVLEVVLSFVLFRPLPHFRFNRRQFFTILHRGKWITGMGILNYLFTTGDNIVIGRILGAASLGIYQNAYRISTSPTFETNDVYYQVTFPVYVQKLKHHLLKLSEIVRHILIYNLLISLAGLTIILLAKPLVLILLGFGWTSAIPAVRILGLLGIIRCISFSFNPVFMTFKRQQYVTLIILGSVIGMGIAILPAINFLGIIGVAWSAVFGSFIALIIAIYLFVKIWPNLILLLK